jgi:transposase
MPRTPLRAISGNSEARKELSPYIRGQIIAYSEIGLSPHQISQKLEIPRRTVRDTITRNPERKDGESKSRSGRPKVLSERDIRHILALIRQEPFIPYRQIKFELNLSCSTPTIYSALKSSGYGHWMARQRPKLEAQHAKKRYEFAIQYGDWDEKEWSNIIFTDECSIELGSGKRRRWVFRLNRRGEKWKKQYVQPIKKGKGVRIMVWAAIWGENRSDLLQLERDFESKKHGYSATSYIEILEEIVRAIYEPGMIFMQDNAPIHKAKKSMDWFTENGVMLMDWPPYSPDLNPIENLWFPLKEGVYKMNPDIEDTSGDEEKVAEVLWKASEASWTNINKNILHKCMKSMKKRMAAVREAGGWYTGY